ncbi:MAG TPA: nuclear transport factor 2 family protein [Syntrophorhabdaceae bacterium]|jgi:ketosteroid isomerase-like protein
MKSSYRIAFVLLLAFLLGACQPQQRTFTEGEKETVRKEVKDQFNQLISAVNQSNADAWSKYYSKDEFLSATAGTDYYATRSAWVDLITKHFAMRDRQHVEPLEVRVTPLAPNVALMTSRENSEMTLKSGKHTKSKHVFTMIWKKEPEGWKIVHSQESWTDEQVK